MERSTATLKLGQAIEVTRLGFGAMRIVGPGIWGEPTDKNEVIRTLKRLPALGVNFIDTADSYGPNISEDLIREALHPYGDIVVATKAGLARTGPDKWIPLGRPEYLIQQAHTSRRRLGVEQIALWQLHRIDPKVPRDEQFGAVRELLDSGVIGQAGLSEVSIADIEAAARVFDVASVQNRYNLLNRDSEAILQHCEARGIAFIPWSPLSAGGLTRPGTPLDTIAKQHRVTTGQIALAWLLRRSPVMLPIPGTSKVSHIEANMAALRIELSDAEFKALETSKGSETR
jgi:pyridoxine 4-dehydrogenase